MQEKPFSQACENNKQPIIDVLLNAFSQSRCVLEIGSGTGQHAVHFAQYLPDLLWMPSDRKENHAGIQAWLDDSALGNIAPLQELDVSQQNWPRGFDAVFSANTAHIMPWELTQLMLKQVAEKLPLNGVFALYGPFNYRGKFSSESNERFELWLKNQAAHHGIRDFENVDSVAKEGGLVLQKDHAMPANNRLLIWHKKS